MMRLDTTRFPLVFMRGTDTPSMTDAAEQALQALLARDQGFVLLTDHLPDEHAQESHTVRKQKALFFKRNKARLRALCRGMIIITGERAISAPLKLAAQAAGKVLGLTVAFVQTECDGINEADRLLAT